MDIRLLRQYRHRRPSLRPMLAWLACGLFILYAPATGFAQQRVARRGTPPRAGQRVTQPKTEQLPITTENINIKTMIPILVVETTAPTEITVGKTGTFLITVRNEGQTPAENVVVHAGLPKNVDLISADPSASPSESTELQFRLGSIGEKESKAITMRLVPRSQGAVDLQTRATFSTSSRSVVRVRRSNLKITVMGPKSADYDALLTYKVVVVNTGDADADHVTVVPHIPAAARVTAEALKPIELGMLPAGESREVNFSAKAIASGVLDAAFEAVETDGQRVKTEFTTKVVRPALQLSLSGPQLTYFNRTGTYEILVSNSSDAVASHVEVRFSLASGIRITKISRKADFNRAENTLTWHLDQLDAGATVRWRVRTVAEEQGSHVNRVVASTKSGFTTTKELATTIAARPSVYTVLAQDDSASEIGEPALFTIMLTNFGFSDSEGVSVSATLPDQLSALSTDQMTVHGKEIIFEPIGLQRGETRRLEFHAKSDVPGDFTIRVAVQGHACSPRTIEGGAFFYDALRTNVISDGQFDQPETTVPGFQEYTVPGGKLPSRVPMSSQLPQPSIR